MPTITGAEMEQESPIRVLSISIDVGSSTAAKAQMEDSRQEEHRKTEWYHNYYREFLRHEFRLYGALFKAAAGDIGWDWKKTFVVKGLGDEIWLLYTIDDESYSALPALFRCFLHAAQDLAITPLDLAIPHDDRRSGEKASEFNFLPLKFYVDFIEHAVEINGPRCDFMLQRLPEILGPQSGGNSEDIADLGNRLNVAHLIPENRSLLTSFRTDYIGWEVDRFFRATKFAIPSVVTVGHALLKEIAAVSRISEKRIGGTCFNEMIIDYPTRQSSGRRSDPCFVYVTNDVSSEDMKGLGEAYTVYHFIRKSNLLDLRQTDISPAIMEETFEVFTSAMEAAVRAETSE